MNSAFPGMHRWGLPLALAVFVSICAGSEIATGQTLEDVAGEGTVADGGTRMADEAFVPVDPIGDPKETAGEAFVPLDPIGDPEETADEVDLGAGIFDGPLHSPETAPGAPDEIELADGSDQGFSLIPEPGTLLTLALAALMLFLLRRKW